jgi:hypothetical protein
MLDGDWKGEVYSDEVKEFADCKFMSYDEYLTMTAAQDPAEKEARKDKRKKKRSSSTKMNHAEVAEVQKWLASPNPKLATNKPSHLRKGHRQEKGKNDMASDSDDAGTIGSTPITTSAKRRRKTPYRSANCLSPKKPAREIYKPENIVRPGEEVVRPGSVLKVFDCTALWEGVRKTKGTLAIVTEISNNSKGECEELETYPWTTFEPTNATWMMPECVVMRLPRGETTSARMMNYDFANRPVLLVPGVLQMQDAIELEQAWKENTGIAQLFALLRSGQTPLGHLLDEVRKEIVAAHPGFAELLEKAAPSPYPRMQLREESKAKREKNVQENKEKAEKKVQVSKYEGVMIRKKCIFHVTSYATWYFFKYRIFHVAKLVIWKITENRIFRVASYVTRYFFNYRIFRVTELATQNFNEYYIFRRTFCCSFL